jgi:hypothetical protein
VAWDQLDSLSSGRFASSTNDVDFTRKGSSGRPRDLPAPTDQSFWSRTATGQDVALDWKFKSGDYTVVLMNADGTVDVASTGRAEVEVPRLSVALAIAAVIGLLLLLVGLFFLFKVGRGRSQRGRAPVAVPAT